MIKYHRLRWGSITLAAAAWLLVTALAVEKVVADGVQSWALLAAVPLLTLAAGILLHIGAVEFKQYRPVRGFIALALALLALAVTLPASIGSSGGARDASQAAAAKSASDLEALNTEMVRAQSLVDETQAAVTKECATGYGKRCMGLAEILGKRQADLEAIRSKLQSQAPAKPVQSGEARVAWLLGLVGLNVSADQIGLVWPVLPPLALELLCAFFLTRGLASDASAKRQDASQTDFDASNLADLPREMFQTEQPEPPKPKKRRPKASNAKAAAWIKAQVQQNGNVPPLRVIQGKYGLPKSTASRVRKEALKTA